MGQFDRTGETGLSKGTGKKGLYRRLGLQRQPLPGAIRIKTGHLQLTPLQQSTVGWILRPEN